MAQKVIVISRLEPPVDGVPLTYDDCFGVIDEERSTDVPEKTKTK
jgi:hypothetical protein